METFKNIFKGLFSNQACLDNHKMKWYVTLILFVFSVFLPWIPSLSSGYQTNAGQVFANVNFEVDTGLKYIMFEEDYFKSIKVVEDKDSGELVLDYSGLKEFAASSDTNNWENEYNGENTTAELVSFTRDVVDDKNKKTYEVFYDCVSALRTVETQEKQSDGTIVTVTKETRFRYLQAFYLPQLSYQDADFTKVVSGIVDDLIFQKQVGTGEIKRAPSSYAIFAKDYLAVYFYNLKSTTANVSPSYTYAGNLSIGLKKCNVVPNASLYDFMVGKTTESEGTKNLNNFVLLADQSARDYMLKSVWMNILSISITNVVCILISSIFVIIFFKKKTSLYRESNYWHAINTSVGMSLCCSLLAMAMGFLNPSYSMMIIIGANLIRAVFVMNKIAPPMGTNGGEQKAVYQARS